jgi:hypothetical protein
VVALRADAAEARAAAAAHVLGVRLHEQEALRGAAKGKGKAAAAAPPGAAAPPPLQGGQGDRRARLEGELARMVLGLASSKQLPEDLLEIFHKLKPPRSPSPGLQETGSADESDINRLAFQSVRGFEVVGGILGLAGSATVELEVAAMKVLGQACYSPAGQVRKTLSRPRSRANFQPFTAAFPPECMGQLASFGPT